VSKNLVEFRRCSGERNKICFLPRHARGGKHFSPRKRAQWTPSAAIARAAEGRNLSVGKGFAFFDGLKRRLERAGAFRMGWGGKIMGKSSILHQISISSR
jgi:hypothetical protein